MFIEIIRPGVFTGRKAEMLPVGTVLEKPDGFTGWHGKWREVEAPADVETVDVDETETEQVTTPVDDGSSLDELRERYELVTGKKPRKNATAETMQAAIDNAMGA